MPPIGLHARFRINWYDVISFHQNHRRFGRLCQQDLGGTRLAHAKRLNVYLVTLKRNYSFDRGALNLRQKI